MRGVGRLAQCLAQIGRGRSKIVLRLQNPRAQDPNAQCFGAADCADQSVSINRRLSRISARTCRRQAMALAL
jgi:hypothetical protein